MKTPPPPRGLVSTLRDFPDRLSPMVVKELRQGLRSPIFVWAFLIMHLILAFTVLVSFGSDDKEDSTVLFWWTVILPLSFILPLRGFNALNEERRLNTHDTLVLTRLNALRITFGKWAAIAAQILLIASTVLPYLVMRYFAGGINVSLELRWLLHFTMLGLLFTAGTVGFSWVKYFFMRGLLTIGMGCLLVPFCGMAVFDTLRRDRSFLSRSMERYEWLYTLGIYALAAYTIYYLLDFAAAQIAPLAENRTTTRRVISLGMLVVFCGITLLANAPEISLISLWMGGLGIAAVAGIDAATEPTRHFSVICQPFVKRGWWGRLAGRFLYPGWHSGIWFMLLLCAIWMTTLLWFIKSDATTRSILEFFSPHWKDAVMIMSTVFGQVLFGLLLIRLLFRNSKIPLILFLLIQLALGLFQGLLAMFASSMRSPGLNLLAFPSPMSHAVYVEEFDDMIRYDTGADTRLRELFMDRWLLISCFLTLTYLAILLVLSAREFRKTREQENLAAQDLAPELTHA